MGKVFSRVTSFETAALATSPATHVVLIDPISTGAVLAQRLQQKGVKIIRVWSEFTPEEIREFVAPGGDEIRFEATIQHEAGQHAKTVAAIQDLHLNPEAVIVGSEPGVLLGDLLAEGLNLRGNGTKLSPVRRNKFLQQERVRECGLDACKQKLALTVADVEKFLSDENHTVPFKAVVKPTEGAGTDGVTLCDSQDEVRHAFDSIAGKLGIFGEMNEGALLQEFLKGDEYVVDTVSVDGEHKCVAIWRYDKRRYNDAPFVYFGMELLPVDAMPHLWPMVRYVWGVLDALGIRNGAMHSEVMQTSRGPVLVEVNCRCHGGEGSWAPMVEACLGYSQVTAVLDAYLDQEAFKALPQVPRNFKSHAREAKLRSNVEGRLTSIDEERLAKIRALPSYKSGFVSPSIAVGRHISKTIDAVSASGNINLVNESASDLQRDYEELHRIVAEGLFTVDDTDASLDDNCLETAAVSSGAAMHVVLIDPISTGAVLAQRLQQKGIKLIRVWSEFTPPEIREFVATGGHEIDYAATVQHNAGCLADTVAAIQQMQLNIVAVVVGCESGVILGDLLSDGLKLRGNGTEFSPVRRNKFLQQERVRECGLDACKQKLALKLSDVEEFLSDDGHSVPFKAVVKPTEGAGTDGVTLCDSHEEVRSAFDSIAGKCGIFGGVNEGALLQEFLKGDEYVIDTVSLDGEHKCVAIWRYDKRCYNNAPFVYFGMQLLPVDAMPHLWPMVRYVWGVLDALGIRNGAMHSEVMQTARGPVLVEVNCRCHGGEGTWAPMVEACLGYSQVTAVLDAYLDPERFNSLPRVPSNFQCHAREAKLRSNVEGTLASIDEERLAKIRALPSYRCMFMNPGIAVGKHIVKTVDAISASGNINLVNDSSSDLARDYDELHRIVAEGLFTVEDKQAMCEVGSETHVPMFS